jgi:hypothetical protein
MEVRIHENGAGFAPPFAAFVRLGPAIGFQNRGRPLRAFGA